MSSPGAASGERSASSLAGSIRRLLATLLDLAQVRVDLLLTEYEQEKLRVFDGLVQAALALLFLSLGLLLGLALLVWLSPEHLRPLVVALLALACLAMGAWLAWRARRTLSQPGGPLAASRAELALDRDALQPHP